MSSSIPTGTTTSYWCYSCSRFVGASPENLSSCPDCHTGSLELIPNNSRLNSASRRNRRRSAAHQSHFNPIIVLRGFDRVSNSFELFYNDGGGAGLRPLPRSVSNFVMGSGFDQLLDQLGRIENSPMGGGENAPASKAAVDSLPTVTISDGEVAADSPCAVCTEALEVGDEVRGMPCKHMFHQNCILPWLSSRNTCPVCRHELPSDVGGRECLLGREGGLTIWRLPGGGFAVGRFGGVRSGDGELPVVYSEIDRSLSSGDVRGRILWSSGGRRWRERRGVGRMLSNFFSMFRCFSPSSLSSSVVRFPSDSEEATS